MTLSEFTATVASGTEPTSLAPTLRALWHAARGDWDAAHGIAQEIESADGSWIHAYLHRVEGDPGNAAYWYRRAGRPVCRTPLDDEWQVIAAALLTGRDDA